MTQGNRHMGTKNLWYNTVCPYDWYTGTLVQKKLYQVLQAYYPQSITCYTLRNFRESVQNATLTRITRSGGNETRGRSCLFSVHHRPRESGASLRRVRDVGSLRPFDDQL